MPDFYLRELKYSHCLSSFFLWFLRWVRVGNGGVVRRVEHAVFCCLVVIKVIEINFITFITPIHPHPCSLKSVPAAPIGTVPYTWASPQCMALKSL